MPSPRRRPTDTFPYVDGGLRAGRPTTSHETLPRPCRGGCPHPPAVHRSTPCAASLLPPTSPLSVAYGDISPRWGESCLWGRCPAGAEGAENESIFSSSPLSHRRWRRPRPPPSLSPTATSLPAGESLAPIGGAKGFLPTQTLLKKGHLADSSAQMSFFCSLCRFVYTPPKIR